MLRGGDNAILTQSLADCHAHIGAEQNILTERLNGPTPAAVPGNIDNRCQRLSDANGNQFLTNGITNLRNKFSIKGRGHADGLGEGGGHAPLGAMEGFTVFNRWNLVRLDIHAHLHIPVNPFRHLGGRHSIRSFIVHKVTGIAVITHSVVTLGFIIVTYRINHLRGNLEHFLLQSHMA